MSNLCNKFLSCYGCYTGWRPTSTTNILRLHIRNQYACRTDTFGCCKPLKIDRSEIISQTSTISPTPTEWKHILDRLDVAVSIGKNIAWLQFSSLFFAGLLPFIYVLLTSSFDRCLLSETRNNSNTRSLYGTSRTKIHSNCGAGRLDPTWEVADMIASVLPVAFVIISLLATLYWHHQREKMRDILKITMNQLNLEYGSSSIQHGGKLADRGFYLGFTLKNGSSPTYKSKSLPYSIDFIEVIQTNLMSETKRDVTVAVAVQVNIDIAD